MEQVRRLLNKNISIFSMGQGPLPTVPLLIMGSFSTMVMHFPVEVWWVYLASMAGGVVHTLLMEAYQVTFGSLSFIFILTIAYAYGEGQRVYDNTHVLFPTVTLCFLITFCYPAGESSMWGPKWSFTVTCIALASCPILTVLYRQVSDRQRLYVMGVAYRSNAFMQSLFPVVATIGISGTTELFLYLVFEDTNIINSGSYLLMRPLEHMGNSLLSMLLYTLTSHML